MSMQHVIDCDTDSNLGLNADSWNVVAHQKGGIIQWSPEEFKLESLSDIYQFRITCNHVSDSPKPISELLVGEPVYNASMWWYLLGHQELIPEECKRVQTVFWGTLLQRVFDSAWEDSPDEGYYVPTFYWYSDVLGYRPFFMAVIGHSFSGFPAAIRRVKS